MKSERLFGIMEAGNDKNSGKESKKHAAISFSRGNFRDKRCPLSTDFSIPESYGKSGASGLLKYDSED